MRKRLKIVLAVLLVGAVGLVVWRLRPEPEPVYDGKPLSFWLNRPHTGELSLPSSILDSNAVPHLIKALDKGGNPIQQVYQRAWPSVPAWLKRHLPQPTDTDRIRLAAIHGLFKLQWDSPLVIPALLRSMQRDSSPGVRNEAAFYLSMAATKDDALRSALIASLSHKDAGVRALIAESLGYARHKRDSVLPALIGCLQDKDDRVRWIAASSLYRLGPPARAAVPHLQRALRDTSSKVREEAAYALKQIDPAAAAKPGVK